MDKIHTIERGPIITDVELCNFENIHSVKLPNDYRNYLLSDNGGISEQYFFEYKYNDEIIEVCIMCWTSLGDKFTSDSFISIESAMDAVSNRVPKNMIPIADSYFGNGCYLISLSDENYGAIYFLDDDKDEGKDLIKISSSFSDFVKRLEISTGGW